MLPAHAPNMLPAHAKKHAPSTCTKHAPSTCTKCAPSSCTKCAPTSTCTKHAPSTCKETCSQHMQRNMLLPPAHAQNMLPAHAKKHAPSTCTKHAPSTCKETCSQHMQRNMLPAHALNMLPAHAQNMLLCHHHSRPKLLKLVKFLFWLSVNNCHCGLHVRIRKQIKGGKVSKKPMKTRPIREHYLHVSSTCD